MKEIIYTHWQNRAIEDINGEIWKYIENTNERYSVSNFGRIKSNRILQSINGSYIYEIYPFILKQYKNDADFLRVCIKYTDKTRHKLVPFLVCAAFNLNTENKKEVNRIINVRTYNHESNLRWATRAEIRQMTISNIGKSYEVIDIIKPNNSIPNTKKRINGKSFIYGITNGNNEIVYIGKSNTPIQRFRQHKTWARNPNLSKKFNLIWLKKLLDICTPSMIIIKEINESEWEFWEKYYISYYKKNGNTLHNISSGGHDISEKCKIVFKEANEKRKISILQYSKNGVLIKEWDSTCEAAKYLGINKQSITRALKCRRPTAHGYIWKYKI